MHPDAMSREALTYAEHLATLGIDAVAVCRDERGTIRPSAESLDEPLVELRVDREYRIGRTVGQGGMGIVRAADQTTLDRQVAIKQVRTDRDDPGARAQLLREARITGALEHPNVVPVHALGLDEDGRPAFVMKHIEGVPWSELLDDPDAHADVIGDDPLGFHLEVLQQVCRAVHYAHARGIVHRDIKPANVMVGSFGEVYVLDWGIAVGLAHAPAHVPRAAAVREIVGTPEYLAPEMAVADGPRIGVGSDVYLLGATLYHVLAGRPPHVGGDVREVLARIWAGQPPDLPPDAPSELAALCRAAMARDPVDRPPTAEAFRRALAAFLSHRSATAMVTEAMARWESLRGLLRVEPVDGAEVARLGAEARFALEQALRDWPEHPTARGTLLEVVEALARHELRHEDPDGAEELVTGWPELAARLAPEIAQTRDRLAARARAAAEMEAERDATDIGIAVAWRLAVTVGLGVGVGAILGPIAWLHETGRHTFGYELFTGAMLGYLATTAVVTTFAGPRALNRVARRVIASLFANTAVVLLGLVALWMGDAPLWIGVLVLVLVLVNAATMGQLAIHVDRRLGGVVALIVMVAPFVVAFRDHPWPVMLVASEAVFLALFLFEVSTFRRARPPIR